LLTFPSILPNVTVLLTAGAVNECELSKFINELTVTAYHHGTVIYDIHEYSKSKSCKANVK